MNNEENILRFKRKIKKIPKILKKRAKKQAMMIFHKQKDRLNFYTSIYHIV